MSSIGFKSWQQVGLFKRLNTDIGFKYISNSCNTEYLVQFKSKYETLKQLFLSMSTTF